jgi:hypothetical protein
MNESNNASGEVSAGFCEVRPDELRQIEGGSLMTDAVRAISEGAMMVTALTGVLAARHAQVTNIVRNF